MCLENRILNSLKKKKKIPNCFSQYFEIDPTNKGVGVFHSMVEFVQYMWFAIQFQPGNFAAGFGLFFFCLFLIFSNSFSLSPLVPWVFGVLLFLGANYCRLLKVVHLLRTKPTKPNQTAWLLYQIHERVCCFSEFYDGSSYVGFVLFFFSLFILIGF